MSDERTANAVDKRLGARVRARRLELGISQEGLADELGITFQQVQKYEKGTNRIAASRLHAIAAALNLPVASFFEGVSRKKGQEADDIIAAALATPEGAELMKLFTSIPNAKVRKRVLDLVRSMTEEGA